MTDPQQLLRDYVESKSESVFRELVKRYIDLVYSVALRRTGDDTRHAEDIVQTVFTDLFKKAHSLPADIMLGSWLYQHTSFVASNVLRSEKRRVVREQQSIEMNMLHDNSDSIWNDLAPVLDDAMQELAPSDRDAVVLRFFEKRDFRSVGAALGVSDDTAQKRVSRALEKLRGLLVQRGVTLGAVALATALTDRSIQAAPALLSCKITGSTGLAQPALRVPRGGLVLKWAVVSIIVALFVGVALHPEFLEKLGTAFGTERKEANSARANQAERKEAQSATDARSAQPVTSPIITESANASTNVLRLTIIADDSGKAVPNVPVAIKCLAGRRTQRLKAVSDRMGICNVPLLDRLADLEVITQIEGFADTRLFWNKVRGQTIPTNYTVRLARAVAIGGRVLDSDGKPVSSARVGWGHREIILPSASVESHHFSWIDVETDAEGRWHLNRIALELIQRIYGSAEHTNYPSTGFISVAGDPNLEKELRAGKHIFRMARSAIVRGVVVDPDGNFVAGATVRCGEKSLSESRSTTTLENGTFVIRGLGPGETVLSAEAEGFAATTIAITAAGDGPPHTLTLQRGRPLRIRVLSHKGEAVSNAAVWLETGRQVGIRNKDRVSPPVQATFDKRTDAFGRVVWEQAPDGELEFGIWAEGYMRDALKARPSEEEHVVSLKPNLKVTGTVRDATTGADIQKFRVICGWPTQKGPRWSTFDRDWLHFEGGKFKRTFSDAMIGGMDNPGYMLKIEAEGYAPFISRAIEPDEGSVHIDAVLKPVATPTVTVLFPDDKPAVEADVGFVFPNSTLQLRPGGFERVLAQNQTALSYTDSRGQFRLPVEEGLSHVIVAHPEGCVQTTPAALFDDPVIYLQPWGKLEGTYRRGGKAVEGAVFTLQFGFAAANDVSYSRFHQVKTDAQGKFTFPKVLPGTHKLMSIMGFDQSDGPSGFTRRFVQEVEIESGKTTTVEPGSNAYTIQARLDRPTGLDANSDISTFALIISQGVLPPEEIINNPAAVKEWQQTSGFKERINKAMSFGMVEQPDGSFRAEDVPAGAYTARIAAFERGQVGQHQTYLWSGSLDFMVPNDPPTGTIDLGVIVPVVYNMKDRVP